MMNNLSTLHVTAIQTSLQWESRKENLNHFNAVLQGMDSDQVDLVVLPEMFTTGFTMNAPHCSDHPEGETLHWMRRQAKYRNAAITGSVIIEENGRHYNRLYFVWPEGRYEIYDKRHTFSFAGEDRVFTQGKTRLVIDYKGWKICPLICYDLRFPVWSRNTEEFDLLLYVANWPASRIDSWDTLLPARAVENLCYALGVNRVGEDGNGISYNGHSVVCDALGNGMGQLEDDAIGLVSAILDKEELMKIRDRYRFLDDRDEFDLLG